MELINECLLGCVHSWRAGLSARPHLEGHWVTKHNSDLKSVLEFWLQDKTGPSLIALNKEAVPPECTQPLLYLPPTAEWRRGWPHRPQPLRSLACLEYRRLLAGTRDK